MKSILRYVTTAVTFGAVTFISACSDKSFTATNSGLYNKCINTQPGIKCTVDCDDDGTCYENYDHLLDADNPITDILFVVDNSGSMSEEQANLGQKFPSFLQVVSKADYRVAITTTDISSTLNPADNNNGNGAFQDGKLITFGNGAPFLDTSVPITLAQDYFETAIQRNETLVCEKNDYEKEFCPSGDERGILAASMTMEQNPSDFIRPMGHMAVVVLSDEDEGSNGNLVDPREVPGEFVGNFKSQYPFKSLAFHSIVIQPETLNGRANPIGTKCFEQQKEGYDPDGHYGNVYAELSALSQGVLGDICADSNYTTQLQEIASSAAQVRKVFECADYKESLEITFQPDPGREVERIYNDEQHELVLPSLPKNTKVRFQYRCRQQEKATL